MSNPQKARDIISKIIYINIASVSKGGEPWNTPVYSAFDSDYNFYWASWKENQHSTNIAENPDVFLTVYDSTAPEGTGEGVYIQAIAHELKDVEEIRQALAILYRRKNQDPEKRKPEWFLGDYPRRVYKAIPERVWMNGNGDVNGNYVDIRLEIDLKGE